MLISPVCLPSQPTLSSPAFAQQAAEALAPNAPYVGDEVVLKLKPGASPKDLRLYTTDLYVTAQTTAALAELGVTVVKVPEGKVSQAVANLKRSPAVEFADWFDQCDNCDH